MKQKDKFLLLMVLSCLPLGNAVAEQTGAGFCTLRLIKKYCRIR